MIPDDAMLMAYADGELDPLAAKRVERAIAADPALAAIVDRHRSLRSMLGSAFDPVLAAPVPDRLTAMLSSTVVPFAAPQPARPRSRWIEAVAIAACLVIGVAIGQHWSAGPIAVSQGRVVASGTLSRALDTRLASTMGDTHVLVSFRDRGGAYCRVFASPAVDGVACREDDRWALRRTQAPAAEVHRDYRQAGSAQAALLASAQDMMAGEPLDDGAERSARARGWR